MSDTSAGGQYGNTKNLGARSRQGCAPFERTFSDDRHWGVCRRARSAGGVSFKEPGAADCLRYRPRSGLDRLRAGRSERSQHQQTTLQRVWEDKVVRVLVDTGPLVAILSPADHYHEVCVRTLANLKGPLLTCWPVITEAAWLLRAYPLAFENLLGSTNGGFLDVLPVTGKDSSQIADILKRYASLRPQFADATLVHLANRENIRTIFTLDRRDFSVYRSARKRTFRILPE